jgi:hypothetical protein
MVDLSRRWVFAAWYVWVAALVGVGVYLFIW